MWTEDSIVDFSKVTAVFCLRKGVEISNYFYKTFDLHQFGCKFMNILNNLLQFGSEFHMVYGHLYQIEQPGYFFRQREGIGSKSTAILGVSQQFLVFLISSIVDISSRIQQCFACGKQWNIPFLYMFGYFASIWLQN